MEAILKFNLPEDNIEYELINNAGKMHSVLWELDQWLRGQTKHAPDSMSEYTYNAYQKCREQLRELMYEHNLSLN